MNRSAPDEDWSDERLDAEGDRYDDLFRRAINEPSFGLPDLRAKAQLALDDFRRQHFCFGDPTWNAQAEADLTDDERLIRVVLEEVIALCA